jgi:hypothetical protein
MATVSKTIFGNISGGVADVVFRRVHGRVFVVSRPATYTLPTDATSIKCRNNFSCTCKLASVINSIELLHCFWEPVVRKHVTVFHTIVKSVYITVNAGSFTSHTMLAPGADWNFVCTSFSCTASQIEVFAESPVLSPDSFAIGETSLMLIAVPVFTSPVIQTPDPLILDALVSEPQALTAGSPLRFLLPPTSLFMQQYHQYRIHKVLMVLVALDEAGKPIRLSDTITRE